MRLSKLELLFLYNSIIYYHYLMIGLNSREKIVTITGGLPK